MIKGELASVNWPIKVTPMDFVCFSRSVETVALRPVYFNVETVNDPN